MACGLGLETREDWISWARSSKPTAETSRSLVTLPPTLRRRVTAVGQMAFRAACELSVPERARFIFCSRHGEFRRTLSILAALTNGEALSPAEFSLSVHNALAGLLSIAWRNTAGHTTIAAGADSFGSALVEAASLLMERPDEPVLLVYFDEQLPEPYDEIADNDETCVAIAMLLTSPRPDPGDTETSDVIVELAPATVAPRSASGEALAFLRFLLADDRKEKPGGEQLGGRWRRA